MALLGWNSIERAAWYSNIFQILALTTVGLGFVFQVLTFALNFRKEHLLAQEAAPRVITPGQREAIANFLRAQPLTGKVTLKASVTAPDARSYADEIAALLTTVGWPTHVDNAILTGRLMSGICVTAKEQQSELAMVLLQALRAGNIDARGAYDPTLTMDANEVWLQIGSKSPHR